MDFPIDLKSLSIKVTAHEQIQTLRPTVKCAVLAGGAIRGRAFFFVTGLLLNLPFLCHEPAPQLCNQEVDFFAEG